MVAAKETFATMLAAVELRFFNLAAEELVLFLAPPPPPPPPKSTGHLPSASQNNPFQNILIINGNQPNHIETTKAQRNQNSTFFVTCATNFLQNTSKGNSAGI